MLPFQDVPWDSASAGESFQLGVLCSGSEITLLLLQTLSLYLLPVDPVQAIMHVYSAIKEVLLLQTHAHTHIGIGEGILCPCMCLLVDLASKLSKTARVNILLEGSNINR